MSRPRGCPELIGESPGDGRDRSHRTGAAAPLAAPDPPVLAGRGAHRPPRRQRPHAPARHRPPPRRSATRSTRRRVRPAATAWPRARTSRRCCSTTRRRSRSPSASGPRRARSIDGIDDTRSRARQARAGAARPLAPSRAHVVAPNVVSLQWGGGPTVDADALAVLHVGVPRPRAGALRLSPSRRRRLPPAGRAPPARVRRASVVPRGVGRPPRRLAHVPARPPRRPAPRVGVRCAPRDLPGGDAAAFVAESIRSMPMPYSEFAVLEVGADVDRCAHCTGATPMADAVGRLSCAHRGQHRGARACGHVARRFLSGCGARARRLAARVDELVARLTRT